MTKKTDAPETAATPTGMGSGDNHQTPDSGPVDSIREQVTALGDNLHQYPIILDTPTRSLPCKLANKEIIIKCKELAKLVRELNEEEQRQSDEKAQMKARLSQLTNRMQLLSRIVDKGEEDRPVGIIIQAHDNDLVQEIRNDTGEIIVSRPALDKERQLALQRLDPSKIDVRD